MKQLEVQGITKVANLINTLTDGSYSFLVWCDDFQASKPKEERWYTVEIADLRDNEEFVLKEEEIRIPSGMSKDY